MSLAKKILNNTLIQVFGKFASTAMSLVAFAFMTRYLGQEGFGKYTTIVTFLSFFAIIADLGLTLVTVQLINEDKDREEFLLGNLFGIRLVSSIFLIGLAPILVSLFNYTGDIKKGVLIVSLSFVFNTLNQVMVGLFQSKLKMNRTVWADLISRAVMIAGVIFAVTKDYGLNSLLVITVLSSFTSFLFHFIFAKRFARIKPIFSWPVWKYIMSLSWPLALTIAFNLIYLKTDTLILSLIKEAEVVGLYGAAYRIIDVLSALPFMLAGVILPLLINAWQLNRRKFDNILQKSFDVMLAAALPMMVGTQFLAKDIIILIAGEEFVEAEIILRILIFAVVAIFLGNMISHAIIAIKAQKKVIWIYAFVGVSSLIAHILLIPKYSYLAAASVTIYSELAISILSIIFIKRFIGFRIHWGASLKALLASLFMGLALYLSPNFWHNSSIGLIISIIASGLIYLAFLLLFKAFSRSDLRLLFNKK